jgi:hypothetical protein
VVQSYLSPIAFSIRGRPLTPTEDKDDDDDDEEDWERTLNRHPLSQRLRSTPVLSHGSAFGNLDNFRISIKILEF